MSQQDFDPYYHWLGIPPHEQPPNHYRLLGISLFEADARVIGNAADQRMLLLRSFQTGPNAMLAQPLMSQVEIARATLLTPGERASYDRLLYSIQQQAAANQHAAYQHHYQPAPPAAVPTPHIAHQQAFVPATNAYYSAEPPQDFPNILEPAVAPQPQPAASFYQEQKTTRPTKRSSGTRQKESEVSVIVQTIVGGLAGLALAYGVITYVLPKLRGQKPIAQNNVKSDAPKHIPLPSSQSQPIKPPPKTHPIPVPPQPPRLPQPLSNPQPIIPASVSSTSKPLANDDKDTDSVEAEGPILIDGSTSISQELPQYLKLPSTVSIEEATLFSHPKLPTDKIDFRLGTIAGQQQLSFRRTQPNTWALTAKPLNEDAPIEIAQITIRKSDALFAWKNLDRLQNLRSSLVNHFLLIDFQGKTHPAQFRKVATQSAITLDLNKDRTETEFKVVLPPPKETIFVRVKEIFSALPAKFKDDKHEVPLGQDIAVCWPQTPGPEMRIRCVLGDNELKIITQNRFVEGNDDSATGITWTFDNLSKTIASMQAKRDKALAEYDAIVNTQIPNALAALSDVESSTPRTGPEMLQRAQLITKFQNDLKRLRMRGSSLEKQVPELEARLAAAPSLKTFMQSVDGSTSVGIEVFARNGDHEIVLLNLTSVAPDTPAADTPAFTRP